MTLDLAARKGRRAAKAPPPRASCALPSDDSLADWKKGDNFSVGNWHAAGGRFG
eukprot:CAMPEP_0116966286 /NCGR_PEP_ID=MMETSP0467-20121206/49759_1 /TAXON_ID=283647 /ORGANISM="Mesodinium pulex, Strain SPMC105" /LENGTH=53 /DNA_ID=CAMNT_0004655763 /DNA_START=55 /DNA_END=213 /DNA_ORIENTATION=+